MRWRSRALARSGLDEGLLSRPLRHAMLVAAVVIVLAHFAVNGDRPITSDEALYLSEAVSISQGRIEYASGDPIVHRPPLYPATLAPILAVSGNAIEAARVVPVIYALAAVAAAYLLAKRLFGDDVAAAAALTVGAADALLRLSDRFFVDTPSAAWLLLTVALLVRARGWAPYAGAGLTLGLAFLTKETAIFWLPLPVLAALCARERTDGRQWRAMVPFYAAFAAMAGLWFGWVALHDGALYKVDHPASAWLLLLVASAALLAFLARRRWYERAVGRRAAAIALLAGWSVASLLVLESRPEPHAIDYAARVPAWAWGVFGTNVEPFALIVPAWAYAAWRCVRGDERMVLPCLVGALGLPVYGYIANRGWEVRQVAPLIVVSYVVLSAATVDFARYVARRLPPGYARTIAATAVMAIACIAGFVSAMNVRDDHGSLEAAADWNTPAERGIAKWLADVPDGATVLASRAYASQLYVDTGGRITIAQLPTVGTTIHRQGVRAVGTLFRYEDAGFAADAPRTWIWLGEHASGDYAIGLAEEDLLQAIVARRADYLLITDDGSSFSSDVYAGLFEDDPAFHRIQSLKRDGVRSHLFRIDRARLGRRGWPLVLALHDASYVAARASGEADTGYWTMLAPNGVLLDGERLTAAQMAALYGD